MLYNVIDRRKNPHHWEVVTVIVEPTWHDNSCKGADKAPQCKAEGLGYLEFKETSLRDALIAASRLPFPATAYVYDLGDGIREVKVR